MHPTYTEQEYYTMSRTFIQSGDWDAWRDLWKFFYEEKKRYCSDTMQRMNDICWAMFNKYPQLQQ